MREIPLVGTARDLALVWCCTVTGSVCMWLVLSISQCEVILNRENFFKIKRLR